MNQVQLSIHSRVEQDGEYEEYDSFAEATLRQRGNLLTLCYQELMGPNQIVDSKLTLHKNERRVALKRSGAIDAVFVFDENLMTPCLYHAGEISLSLDIRTESVCVEERDGRLMALLLEYQLFSGTQLISGHTMRIELDYSKTALKNSNEDDII